MAVRRLHLSGFSSEAATGGSSANVSLESPPSPLIASWNPPITAHREGLKSSGPCPLLPWVGTTARFGGASPAAAPPRAMFEQSDERDGSRPWARPKVSIPPVGLKNTPPG